MHVMVDSETWGVLPGCSLRSIGAVVFDPANGALHDTFYRNITDASCEAAGLIKEPGTVKFWADQSEAAQRAFEHGAVSLGHALLEFNDWWVAVGGRHFWAHGANFDPPILEAAYEAMMLSIPWKFWDVRCCRTVLALGNRKPQRVLGDVQHQALDDARAQARAVGAVFRDGLFNPA